MGYTVSLDIYEGPLDLLLRLIERQELDITRVSLALVADQYLDYLGQLHELNAEGLADFLVIAAKLLVIKSRSLLPPPVTLQPESEEDDGDSLVRQLAEYRRFKQAAAGLRALEQRGLHTFLRIVPAPRLVPQVEHGSLEPRLLLSALMEVLNSQPPLDSVDTIVQPVVVRITDCIQTIMNLLRSNAAVPLSAAIKQAGSRQEVIVLFLAVLELIKQQQVQVQQEHPFGEIILEQRAAARDTDLSLDELEDYGEELPE